MAFNPPSWHKPQDYNYIPKSIDALFDTYQKTKDKGLQMRQLASQERRADEASNIARNKSIIESEGYDLSRDYRAGGVNADNRPVEMGRSDRPKVSVSSGPKNSAPSMEPEEPEVTALKGAITARREKRQKEAEAQQVGIDKDRAQEKLYRAQATRGESGGNKPPPGYRFLPNGDLEPIPGGPAAQKIVSKNYGIDSALNLYETAREGLLSGLSGSNTGPIMGRLPAFTSAQQVAEGGVAAMAPVLKQLFRVSGEGVFTDRDQQLLLDMIPTRKTHPEAYQAQIENIDRIVRAKLGMVDNGNRQAQERQAPVQGQMAQPASGGEAEAIKAAYKSGQIDKATARMQLDRIGFRRPNGR